MSGTGVLGLTARHVARLLLDEPEEPTLGHADVSSGRVCWVNGGNVAEEGEKSISAVKASVTASASAVDAVGVAELLRAMPTATRFSTLLAATAPRLDSTAAVVACLSIERALSDLAGSPATLFKEVLSSNRLETHLPEGLPHVLRCLLLPSGMNLRNLLTHGFLCTANLDTRYTLFLLAAAAVVAQHSPPCVPPEADKQFAPMPSPPIALLPCVQVFATERVLVGRGDEFRWALEALYEGNPIESLLRLLPPLEMCLRSLFCKANGLPDMLEADVGKYYATLDGFGQRDKHHVMLLPELSSGPNALLSSLGPGLHSVLTDLFMMEHGPLLRGIMMHGVWDEVDPSLLTGWARLAAVVAAAVVYSDGVAAVWTSTYPVPGVYSPSSLLGAAVRDLEAATMSLASFLHTRTMCVSPGYILRVSLASSGVEYTVSEPNVLRFCPSSQQFVQRYINAAWGGAVYTVDHRVLQELPQDGGAGPLDGATECCERLNGEWRGAREIEQEEVRSGHIEVCRKLSQMCTELQTNLKTTEARFISADPTLRTAKRRSYCTSLLAVSPTLLSLSRFSLAYVTRRTPTPALTQRLLQTTCQLLPAVQGAVGTDKYFAVLKQFVASKSLTDAVRQFGVL